MNIILGITSMLLFVLGVTGFLVRRNPLVMFMAIELMLIGVNLGLITLGACYEMNFLEDVGHIVQKVQ